MNFEGKVTLHAEQAVVWEFLLDVDQFSACMPGVEKVTKSDEHTFSGSMKAKVGPLSGEFDFRARIVESVPPTQLRALVEGTDTFTKSTVTSEVDILLTAIEPEKTELTYKAIVDIDGRLAIIGEMVLRPTGSQLIQAFFKRVIEKVESPTT